LGEKRGAGLEDLIRPLQLSYPPPKRPHLLRLSRPSSRWGPAPIGPSRPLDPVTQRRRVQVQQHAHLTARRPLGVIVLQTLPVPAPRPIPELLVVSPWC